MLATAPLPGEPGYEEHIKRIIASGKQARDALRLAARANGNAFCQFVLRDERHGKRIAQAPMHQEWHDLLDVHERLLIWSHVEAGKTNQIAVGRVLYELGRDPGLRVCIISNTGELAKKMTRQAGQYIEKSVELHEVFPNLLPTDDPSLPWKAQALTVRRPGVGAKDPSIQATGVHGNIIGSRIDLLVFDDILDFENTHTPGPRDDVYRWLKNIFGRLTENARVWGVGNAWHPEDAMHRLAKEERFKSVRFPAITPAGELMWPERWSHERIEKARQDLGPLEYARLILCQARDDTSARFKREWVDVCLEAANGMRYCEDALTLLTDLGERVTEDDALARDAVKHLAPVEIDLITSRLGGAVITGVDLAVQAKDSSDLTALFTLWVMPDGTRRVLNVESGRWTGPEIIERIKSVHRRFGSIFIVENNAAQDYLVQFLRRDTMVPVYPFTTGRNKAHPEFGVESLAAEMSAGKWLIPNIGGVMHKEVSEWVQELLFYDPKEHTGDRVMASWFAREGARRFSSGGPSTGIGCRVF